MKKENNCQLSTARQLSTVNCQLSIVGGGAAGLAVCALLSKKGVSSVVLERNPRVGKKLLSTGNGRCNLGHVPLNMSAYHGDVEFAKRVFADWRGAESFFKQFGLVCRADTQGRLYPYSNTANSVSDSLRNACTRGEFLTDTPCSDITPSPKGGFIINKNIYAQRVIWACGSAAGVSGEASPNFSILEKLGHTIVPPHPALCPVITDKALTRSVKGLRIRALCNAVVGNKIIKSEEGEVQFNDGALSGICIMNLSRLVRDYGNALTVSLDLAPEYTLEQLRVIPLSGLFHKRVAEVLAKKPLETIKDWCFPVTGTAEQSKAQVMSGGIPADELNDDMSSKIHPGLYIIGEAVNVDGDCGGYNLEWAWATAQKLYNGL
ncbi:MAG: NAD(P)/FAD-dependent oxidoreductase [Oscillospiraceae bacterium]|nr:NAD(P)/FAD-dependent oxidoreductase [Oscillospiraceae bacterium]